MKLADIDPTTLDPAISTETTSTQYIMLIYSGLLKLNSDLEPVGDIAESWGVSADGKVYTFNLRKDVTFQNGHAVTAADFKYSWERAANPSTGSGQPPPIWVILWVCLKCSQVQLLKSAV